MSRGIEYHLQRHLLKVDLVLATTSDIPQLVLLLISEPARLQKVLLPSLVSITIFTRGNNLQTTWNSSIPVETTFCWSVEDRPRSAASLSSLSRAAGYSLECMRALSFFKLLTFVACSLTSTTKSRHLWETKKGLYLILVGPQIIPYIMGGKTQGMMRGKH